MPELPEVETVRRVLEPQLAGRLIKKTVVNRPEVIGWPRPERFCEGVAEQHITGLERRGKFLLVCLAGGTVVVHLRMTGRLVAVPSGFPEEKHTHVVFHLDNGTELRFIDTRRFGKLWWIPDGEEDRFSGLGKLGPEPFGTAVDAGYLRAVCGTRKRAVKECLLDQSIIAGIGNIYADEILFASHIRPDKPARSLSEAEWKSLAKTIPERLNYFIEKRERSTAILHFCRYTDGKGSLARCAVLPSAV